MNDKELLESFLNNYNDKGRKIVKTKLDYAQEILGLKLLDLSDGIRGAMWRGYISKSFEITNIEFENFESGVDEIISIFEDTKTNYKDVKLILEKYKDIIIDFILNTTDIRRTLLQQEKFENGTFKEIVSREDLNFLDRDFLSKIVNYILKNDTPDFPNIQSESFDDENFWFQQAYIVLICETLKLIRSYGKEFLDKDDSVSKVKEDINFGIYTELGYDEKDEELRRRLGRSFDKNNIQYFFELEDLQDKTKKLLAYLSVSKNYNLLEVEKTRLLLEKILKNSDILIKFRNGEINKEEIDELPKIDELFSWFKVINRELILDSLICPKEKWFSVIESSIEGKFMLLHFLPEGNNNFDEEMTEFMDKNSLGEYHKAMKKNPVKAALRDRLRIPTTFTSRFKSVISKPSTDLSTTLAPVRIFKGSTSW